MVIDSWTRHPPAALAPGRDVRVVAAPNAPVRAQRQGNQSSPTCGSAARISPSPGHADSVPPRPGCRAYRGGLAERREARAGRGSRCHRSGAIDRLCCSTPDGVTTGALLLFVLPTRRSELARIQQALVSAWPATQGRGERPRVSRVKGKATRWCAKRSRRSVSRAAMAGETCIHPDALLRRRRGVPSERGLRSPSCDARFGPRGAARQRGRSAGAGSLFRRARVVAAGAYDAALVRKDDGLDAVP
jgi:hypothetical protein